MDCAIFFQPQLNNVHDGKSGTRTQAQIFLLNDTVMHE
jgi:hypothetical protein